MYTYEQRMKAVKLYIKYEHRAKAVSRELGYPHPNFLVRWYKEYLENGDLKSCYHREEKYSQEQKQYALQYYAEHGRCASQTVRNLGYRGQNIAHLIVNPESGEIKLDPLLYESIVSNWRVPFKPGTGLTVTS